jgi:hypothetical protein
VHTAGRHGPRRREIPEAYGGRRAAPNPGRRGRRCGIRAWFESESWHLVHLVVDEQREVVKGSANDGVGTIVQRLERRYMAVPPHKHHRSAGEVVGQPRRRLAGGGGVVSSGSVFGSTQCLRKLFKKNFGRNLFYYYLKCLLGLIRQFYRIFLRHDTAYALFRFHKVLHYLRHDTADALKYFTVLSFDIKRSLIILCLQLMTMEAK